MKGFIFILLIYSLTFLGCLIAKILLNRYYSNKKSGENSPPKIYYITKPKKAREKPNVIPIKATVVEKEDIIDKT